MVRQGNRKTFSAFSSLRRFAEEESERSAKAEAAPEHCDLCGEPIEPEHRHLLEVSSREMKCACRPCSILFDSEAASEGRYRLVPDRRLSLEDFEMSDARWESLRVPVDMAFFFYSTPAERVVAFYPSPAGATESELPLEAWDRILEADPELGVLLPDVEALLIRSDDGVLRCNLVPIDACYELVGRLRMLWRGFDGGREAHEAMDAFFAKVDARSKVVERGS